MTRARGVLLTAVAIALIASSTWSGAAASSASGIDIQDTLESVSGHRMLATIEALESFGSRAFYLDSSLDAADYIEGRFSDLGLWVRVQYFDVSGYSVPNIIAVKNGTAPDVGSFLFGAHYDSTNKDALNYTMGASLSAPGADDDASGVAAVIELATVMKSLSIQSTVKFVAFGAEEAGLNGSRAFAIAERASGESYIDTVIMDMVGYRAGAQNKVTLFTNHPGVGIPGGIEHAVAEHGLNLSIDLVPSAAYAFSDHYPFLEQGYPTTAILEEFVNGWPVNPYYHTENDTSEHISVEQMENVTRAVMAAFLELGVQTPEPRGLSVVWIAVIVAAALIITVALIVLMKKVL